MACKCGACGKKPGLSLFDFYLNEDGWVVADKEDQKARMESQPTLKPDQSFESRVVSLAESLYDNKRNLDSTYGWGNALDDAITILTVEESYL